MATSFIDFAQESLARACTEVLPAALEAPPPGDEALCRAAVIGFAGSNLRGALGIAVSEQGLQRVYDAVRGSADFGDGVGRAEDDSLAELSNVLLGFIKRAWLKRSLVITLATPIVIRGLSIEVRNSVGTGWFSIDSSSGCDRLSVWLDVECEDDLELPPEDQQVDNLSEGEALLF